MQTLRVRVPLLLPDRFHQALVLCGPVQAVVDLAVAAWTDNSYEPSIVWTAVAEPPSMMGLKVGLSPQSDEECKLIAALTDPSRLSEGVATDRCRASVKASARCSASDLGVNRAASRTRERTTARSTSTSSVCSSPTSSGLSPTLARTNSKTIAERWVPSRSGAGSVL